MTNHKHNPKQMAAFIEAAKAAETDDDETKFNAILKKVATSPKPKDDKPADPK